MTKTDCDRCANQIDGQVFRAWGGRANRWGGANGRWYDLCEACYAIATRQRCDAEEAVR